jgi:hypothetical protein
MSTPTEYAPIHAALSTSSSAASFKDLAQKLQDIIEREGEVNTSPSAKAAPLVIKRSAWEFNESSYPAAPCPTPIATRHGSFAVMKC